jgi:hypothetical protein
VPTKQCTGECGLVKDHSKFPQKHGKPHGGICTECNNEKRRAKNAAKSTVIKDSEAEEIKEKYKDDPVERKRLLANAKARRYSERERQKFVNGIKISEISEKLCKGGLCDSKLQPVTNFSKQNGGDGYQTWCKDCTKYKNSLVKEKFADLDLENTFKVCEGLCGENKALSCFDSHVGYEYGRNNICKNCRHEDRVNIHYEPLTEGTKFCHACDKECDVSEFYRDEKNKDGLQSSCKKHQIIKNNKSYSKYPNAITKMLNDARKNAKRRHIHYDLTKDDIDELFRKQDGKCALTLEIMTHDYTTERQEGDMHIINPTNMSIDRIECNKPYIKSNIQLVCAIVNRIKYTLNPFELTLLCIRTCNKEIFKKGIQFGLSPIGYNNKIELSQEMKVRILQKYKNTISNAKSRDLEVNITEDDIEKLYTKQNGKCEISGEILTCLKLSSDLSIDRIDSTKNYTVNNVQLVTDRVNKLKSDMPTNVLIQWLNKIKTSPVFLSQL